MVNKSFLKNLNALYVEDEIEASNKLSKFLSRVFNNVYVCANGKEALEVFSKNHIDLVISDINMPIVDGLEMSEEIKKIDKNIPIILTTARTETKCLIKAIELNVDSYLLKPIELDVLMDKIYSIADKIEARESRKLLEQYKEAIDESSIVLKFNIEGRITFINSKYEKITGYTFEQVKDKFFNFNNIKDTPSNTFSELWEKIEEKQIWKGKIKGTNINGDIYAFNTTVVPILDKNFELIEYLAISNDITEEEALNELLQFEISEFKENLTSKIFLLNEYKRCLDISSLLVSFDTDLKITKVNSKFLELTNKNINKFFNRNIESIIKNKEQCDEVISSLLAKETKECIVKMYDSEKNKIHIGFTFSPVFNEKGEVLEYLAVGYDLTEIINLKNEIEKTQKDLILTLGTVCESRSKETANHVKRVAAYSYLLAKEYGLSEEEANLLKSASPMHDIGKIVIPDTILHKPGKLTFEEYEVMKKHTTIGFEMFKNSHRKILKSSSIVALEHHERWDGKGYPNGLKGEDIHIFGRITAVADVFDALCTNRCYKKAWDVNEIEKYMYEQSGKEFDPKVVNVFLKNINKVLEIREKYGD